MGRKQHEQKQDEADECENHTERDTESVFQSYDRCRVKQSRGDENDGTCGNYVERFVGRQYQTCQYIDYQ